MATNLYNLFKPLPFLVSNAHFWLWHRCFLRVSPKPSSFGCIFPLWHRCFPLDFTGALFFVPSWDSAFFTPCLDFVGTCGPLHVFAKTWCLTSLLVVADIASLTPLFSWLKGVPPGINPSSRQQKKSTVNTVGLQMAEPDLVSIQLRSLPDSVKDLLCITQMVKAIRHTATQHRDGKGNSACFLIWVFQARGNFTNWRMPVFRNHMTWQSMTMIWYLRWVVHATHAAVERIPRNSVLQILLKLNASSATSTDIYPRIARRDHEDRMAKVLARGQRV